MQKLFIFLLIFLQTISLAHADNPCDSLYSNLSDDLKKTIPSLTWVDVNPINLSIYCQFVIRYYPCNEPVQKQIDAVLPHVIQEASPHCTWVTQGQHHQTEGYCTLDNVLAKC